MERYSGWARALAVLLRNTTTAGTNDRQQQITLPG